MEEMQIEVGMIFVDAVLHKRYRIIAVTGNNITFCRMDCTQLEITAWSVNHLRKVLNQGGGELQTDEQNCVVDREKLSPTFQQTFSKREAAVREVEACFGPTYSELFSVSARPKIAEICKNAGIGRTTFWKAVRIYLQNGLDINSLHDGRQFRAKQGEIHYQKKTGRHAEYGSASEIIVTPEIRAQFDEAIKEYTSGRAQTLTKAYDFLCTAYYTETVCSADGKTLSLKPITERPSFRQFSYYASTVLTKEAKDIMKTSRQEQRNNQRLLLSDSLNGIFGPGDCVEIDETEADISLVSSIVPDVVVSRPIMHFMVDVYTRAIVAFSVSFENNSVLGLTNCLLNLSDDKVDLGRRYGIETSKDQWIPGFIPKRIRCDRGSEYRSNEAERIFNELGITRELVSPGAGSLKGVVEQMFRQFHLNVNPHTEHIGQIQKRHDSKHHQQATLNVEQFTAMVITFVITHNQSYMERYPRTADMYQQKIEPTPLDLWRYGVNQYGNPRPIVNREQFLYSLMKPVTVKISRSGLMWRGLNYLNLTGPYFRERMYSAGRKQEHFDARMDPRSVDALYYLHENRLMRAPLNDAKTGNTDFAGMTTKEYESFYREKKKIDKFLLRRMKPTETSLLRRLKKKWMPPASRISLKTGKRSDS